MDGVGPTGGVLRSRVGHGRKGPEARVSALNNSRKEPTNAILGTRTCSWFPPGAEARLLGARLAFRHELYEGYKEHRPDIGGALGAAHADRGPVAAIGLPVLEVPGTEADDVMGTLARLGAEAGHEVVLVTGDKDMLQVVGPRVKVMVPQTRDQYLILDSAGVKEKWGVGPESIRDVLALMGDSSDNIPGVPGVGEKTAVELMKQFGSVDELYRRLDEVKRPALRAKLEAHREQAMLSRELATVRTDLDLPFGLEDLRCGPVRRDALTAFAKRWEVRRLEQVADSLGVADHEAGTLAPARSAERRGTGAETPAEGVKLAGAARRRSWRRPRPQRRWHCPHPALPRSSCRASRRSPPPRRPPRAQRRARSICSARATARRTASRSSGCAPACTRCAPAPFTASRCCRWPRVRGHAPRAWWDWRSRHVTAPRVTSRSRTSSAPISRPRRPRRCSVPRSRIRCAKRSGMI